MNPDMLVDYLEIKSIVVNAARLKAKIPTLFLFTDEVLQVIEKSLENFIGQSKNMTIYELGWAFSYIYKLSDKLQDQIVEKILNCKDEELKEVNETQESMILTALSKERIEKLLLAKKEFFIKRC